MDITILLPKLGESIHRATIVQWLKKENDPIEKDEPLVEVATEKVNSEIPSTVRGVVKKILVEKGKEVEVGQEIAIITTEEDVRKEETKTKEDFLSPAVLKLMKEHHLSLEEIKKIPKEGRLSKKDIEQYLETRQSSSKTLSLNPMRKAIAENVLLSSKEIPSASLITKVDVTALMEWIQENKEALLKKEGVKISITAFALKALAEAIVEFPLVNASLEKDKIIFHSDVHIGVAVSIEGGLVVPVIRSCQKKGVVALAKELQTLAIKARQQKLEMEEMKGGTITLTNFGMTGIQMGFPIIRYPEVAIVGMGAIHKELAVLPDDTTAICSMMYLSLSFDHRLFDGIYACNFLRKVQIYLEEKPRKDLL